MWRALFLAIGITTAIIGAECMLIERATLTDAAAAEVAAANDPNGYTYGVAAPTVTKDVVPPEWAPWSLMAAGAVIVIYSFSIPKRVAGT